MFGRRALTAGLSRAFFFFSLYRVAVSEVANGAMETPAGATEGVSMPCQSGRGLGWWGLLRRRQGTGRAFLGNATLLLLAKSVYVMA